MTNLLHLGTSNNFEALLFFVFFVFLYFMQSVSVQVRSGSRLPSSAPLRRRKPRSQANLGTRLRRQGQRPRQKVNTFSLAKQPRASRFFVHFLCRPNTTMT